MPAPPRDYGSFAGDGGLKRVHSGRHAAALGRTVAVLAGVSAVSMVVMSGMWGGAASGRAELMAEKEGGLPRYTNKWGVMENSKLSAAQSRALGHHLEQEIPDDVAAGGVEGLRELGVWANGDNRFHILDGAAGNNATNGTLEGWDWWKYQLFESNWWDPVIIDNFVQDVFCGEGQAYDHRQMEYVCDHDNFMALIGLGCMWQYHDHEHPFCRTTSEILFYSSLVIVGILLCCMGWCMFGGCLHELKGRMHDEDYTDAHEAQEAHNTARRPSVTPTNVATKEI